MIWHSEIYEIYVKYIPINVCIREVGHYAEKKLNHCVSGDAGNKSGKSI